AAELSRYVTSPPARAPATAMAGSVALGLALHPFPGIPNPVALASALTGPTSTPFTQYANFDETAAGLALLAYFSPRLRSKSELGEVFAPTAITALATTVLLLGVGVGTDYFAFDPKLPPFTLTFLAINLLFTCVAEEAFF